MQFARVKQKKLQKNLYQDLADEADEVQEPAVYDEWDRVAPQLQELTDIPYYLYQECRHEGMTEEEAVEETLKRFWE